MTEAEQVAARLVAEHVGSDPALERAITEALEAADRRGYDRCYREQRLHPANDPEIVG